ncbi:hypothetical protein N5853_14565 (plasmid) [Bartonella sp. HY329]|uniref:hypothetical protein n=1 Tax=unclassified Bartonella TaxID=2645622 RepID=UPI0021CA88C4|nr:MULTISPECIES: hypothetical protein [unclassified Bartonella]UXM96540.1 hypothetical protein N5853_14565 [Bartonella sp. HY329]UXN10863.1 hypothetical protein N5852_14570 [Bartonella sp. HY328]
MNSMPYKFYKIDQAAPIMSCQNIFVKQTNKDIIVDIIINNYNIHDHFDFKIHDIFLKNADKPYGEKIFLHVIDAKYNGSILILRVKTTDFNHLFIDEFGNGLLKLSPTERVWQNKSEKWKLYYLISIYSSFGFVDVQKPEIIIEGDKIFSELDFFCEVGFSIGHQWAYIGNNYYNFQHFLHALPQDIRFIWKNFDLSKARLKIESVTGENVVDYIDNSLRNKHKVIYE